LEVLLLSPLILISFVLAFFLGWNIGANDASNSIATSVGSGGLSLRKAIVLLIAFEILGSILIGHTVIRTIGVGIVPHIDPLGAVVAVLSTCMWILLCTRVGLPVSTTHAIVGAVLGYALVAYGAVGVNWSILSSIFASWILSPFLALGLALVTHRVVSRVFERERETRTLVARLHAERLLKYILAITACYYALSWGAHDVGTATGVVYSLVSGGAVSVASDIRTMIYLSLFGAVAIAIGALTYGYKVINTIGYRITRLSIMTAFVAQFSAASCSILFTVVPYLLTGWGLPVSSTHAMVGAVIGAGISRGSVSKVVTGTIFLAWLLTIPCAACVSASLYILLRLVGG